MRKISKSRSAIDNQRTPNHNNEDGRPRRMPGATITSWHGSPEIDLEAIFADTANGPTVAGAAGAEADRRVKETVALSDGTEITFAATNQFE